MAGVYQRGYCTHNSILFGPWHRAYLALFEQTLVQLAQQIAAEYPPDSRPVYEAAAATLRLPYWDWALRPTVPDVLAAREISVVTPSGWRVIANPLFSYRFNPKPGPDVFLPRFTVSAVEFIVAVVLFSCAIQVMSALLV